MRKTNSIAAILAAVCAAEAMGGCSGQQPTQTAVPIETTIAPTSTAPETTTVPETTTAAETTVSETSNEESGLTWDMAEEILTHIKEPEFPDYSVSVIDYGAVPDDDQLDTVFIQKAIDEVSGKGGGKVIIPSGTFDVGALNLLSNVNLSLEEEDSVLRFTKEINEENYPLRFGHWEASECYNYSAFIYANGQKNIALTGKGVLDGQANDEDNWWDWVNDGKQTDSRNKLVKMNNDQVPVEERVFGDGEYLRPNFFQTIECENILVEGVTFKNSPMWEVNPVLSQNIIVRNIRVDTIGHNNDGCDPESCNYVLIEDNYFNTGDDCIAIKSGRDEDGRRINTPCQNIIIRNNTFANGHGGITVGSEMNGGVRNVFADNNILSSPDLNYALRFKTNAKRGGTIENIYLRNTTIETVEIATLHATMLYEEGANGPYMPKFKNFTIENLKSDGGLYGFFMEAFQESPIEGIVMKNVEINNCGTPLRTMNWKEPVLENVKINGEEYPRPTEVRILGVPAAGQTIQADTKYIGGKSENISYTWEIADDAAGTYTVISEGKELELTSDLIGRFVKLTASDKNERKNESIPYKVLDAEISAAEGYSLENLNRVLSKQIISGADMDMGQPVTNREMARLLAGIYGLSGTESVYDITDIPADDPDYGMICAVLERQFMTLKMDLEEKEAPTDEGYVEDIKSGYFDPSGTITREEMGSIIMKSCGVNYKNCMGGTPLYDDLDQIDETYYMDVARAQYFDLICGDDEKTLNPKKEVSNAEAIEIAARLSDFLGK